MANFNKCILAGNLCRDPELRYTPKGIAVCQVGLAINRTWTDDSGQKKEEVCFVDATAFGRTAENIGQYMKKGRPMLIEGRLRTESWDDKQTGQKRSKLSVIIDSCQFLGTAADTGAAPAARTQRSPAAAAAMAAAYVAGDGPREDDDGPVPF